MEHNITIVEKSRVGYTARTSRSLGHVTGADAGERYVEIVTRKGSNGGVCTRANVSILKADGCVTTLLFGDYSTSLFLDLTVRCTEKTVREQHARYVAKFDEIEAAARAHYGEPETDAA